MEAKYTDHYPLNSESAVLQSYLEYFVQGGQRFAVMEPLKWNQMV